MARGKLSVRYIKEILRLRYEAKLSQREISRSVRVSVGSVNQYLARAVAAGIRWPVPDDMDHNALVKALFPDQLVTHKVRFVIPDWPTAQVELRRKGVTKQTLWEEYCQSHPHNAYSYSQYCHHYQVWLSQQRRSMRQVHKAGEKLFIDYAGPTVPVINPDTGEIRQAAIFVAVLGASNYSFAEATWGQSLSDWLESHVRAFEFLGGTPTMLVPDNLKSAVNKACRYEPELNRSYNTLAEHYSVAVIPARPRKPKDKSKAEGSVLLVERWILAKIRHETFFTLASLNARIRELLDLLNNKPFQKLPGSRRSQFESLDKPVLRPLPTHRYQYVDIKKVRVGVDYHIEYQKHFYSVPHQLSGYLEVHASSSSVQVYHLDTLITTHPRKYHAGFTTNPVHMPENHRAHATWTPERLLKWGGIIGPNTKIMVQLFIDAKSHPEQAYRACLGLLNLNKLYGDERLENACRLGVVEGLRSVKNIRNILKHKLDQIPTTKEVNAPLNQHHENVRGSTQYQ
ncbi:MAG: IS21 family transposase [bacterium]|nr:IS21 family transposase [Gammaproteobacteria bacterium]